MFVNRNLIGRQSTIRVTSQDFFSQNFIITAKFFPSKGCFPPIRVSLLELQLRILKVVRSAQVSESWDRTCQIEWRRGRG